MVMSGELVVDLDVTGWCLGEEDEEETEEDSRTPEGAKNESGVSGRDVSMGVCSRLLVAIPFVSLFLVNGQGKARDCLKRRREKEKG